MFMKVLLKKFKIWKRNRLIIPVNQASCVIIEPNPLFCSEGIASTTCEVAEERDDMNHPWFSLEKTIWNSISLQ